MIALGYVGAGEWGERKHLAAIEHIRSSVGNADVRIVALCEKDPVRARAVAQRYGIERVYYELEQFALDPEVNCFSVTVTPSSLAAVLPVLARRELPVFCEKPLGTSATDADRFAGLFGAPTVVGFNRRFYPIVNTFKEIIDDLPPPVFVDASFSRHRRTDSRDHANDPTGREPPFVIGTAIHMINLLEYTVGTVIDVDTIRLGPEDDTVPAWHCRLGFEDARSRTRIPGTLTILPYCGKHTERIEYHTADVSVGLVCSLYCVLDYPGTIVVTRNGREEETIAGDPAKSRIENEGFVDEYLEFFSLVRHGGTSRSDFRSAVNSMRVAEAIEKW